MVFLALHPRFHGNSFIQNLIYLNWSSLNSIVKGWIYGLVSVAMLDSLSSGMIDCEQRWLVLEESYISVGDPVDERSMILYLLGVGGLGT